MFSMVPVVDGNDVEILERVEPTFREPTWI